MATERDDEIDLRAYLAVLRDRLRMAGAVAAVVMIATALYSFTRPPSYEATARVVIKPPPTAATNIPPVNLETERQVAASQEVASAVEAELSAEIGAQDLVDALTVRQVPASEVLEFEVSLEEAELTQQAANSFAQAYVSYRSSQVREALARAEQLLVRRLGSTRQQLARITNEMAAADSASRAALQERRATLLVQVGLLEQRLADLQPETTAELSAARVIEAAELPGSPAFPNHGINLLLGAALGILLGVLVAFAHYFWTTSSPPEE